MFDYENSIFTSVATALRAEFSGISVSGEYCPIPASFPAVSVVEMDNTIYTRYRTIDGTERYGEVAYEVNVYSNLSSGRKAQAKAIMQVIDTKMQSIGFTRTSNMPIEVPNAETSIYRMVARYKAIVDGNRHVYRR